MEAYAGGFRPQDWPPRQAPRAYKRPLETRPGATRASFGGVYTRAALAWAASLGRNDYTVPGGREIPTGTTCGPQTPSKRRQLPKKNSRGCQPLEFSVRFMISPMGCLGGPWPPCGAHWGRGGGSAKIPQPDSRGCPMGGRDPPAAQNLEGSSPGGRFAGDLQGGFCGPWGNPSTIGNF